MKRRKTLSEALDELPDGVIVVPINDVERLHNLFLEIFDEHPNSRRDVRPADGTPAKGGGSSGNDGTSK